MTDYTISNNNGTIKAYNENTQQVEFTSTDARTVFNKVVDTLNSINGGSVLLKRGNYAIVNGSVKLRDNQNWIGEDRDLTIISSRDGNVEVFKRTSSELVNYKLYNLTLRGMVTLHCYIQAALPIANLKMLFLNLLILHNHPDS